MISARIEEFERTRDLAARPPTCAPRAGRWSNPPARTCS
jgi:hypothetical protein